MNPLRNNKRTTSKNKDKETQLLPKDQIIFGKYRSELYQGLTPEQKQLADRYFDWVVEHKHISINRLRSIWRKSYDKYKKKNKSEYGFKNLYRILCQPELIITAYANLKSNRGATTKGINKDTIDGFNYKKALELAQKLSTHSFRPLPVRRIYIPKPGKTKMRPLGLPVFEDKIVQEMIRMILTCIYEPLFSIENHNYGFRPNYSPLQAIRKIFEKGQSMRYAIEGDIKGAYDNVNHKILIYKILARRILDRRFLKLLFKFCRAGILDQNKITCDVTGVPQGGIASPILFNIYLYELDKYVEKHITELVTAVNKRKNKFAITMSPEYRKAKNAHKSSKNKLTKIRNKEARKGISIRTLKRTSTQYREQDRIRRRMRDKLTTTTYLDHKQKENKIR